MSIMSLIFTFSIQIIVSNLLSFLSLNLVNISKWFLSVITASISLLFNKDSISFSGSNLSIGATIFPDVATPKYPSTHFSLLSPITTILFISFS